MNQGPGAAAGPEEWRQALWASALAPLAMLGALDVPARMSPSPAWFALSGTAPALLAAAAQPGALRAAINYYRATLRANPLAQAHTLRRVDIPTLIIWGDQDRYLGRELAEPDCAWVPEVRVERIPQASHWVQADAPERVNQLMVDFLQPIRG